MWELHKLHRRDWGKGLLMLLLLAQYTIGGREPLNWPIAALPVHSCAIAATNHRFIRAFPAKIALLLIRNCLNLFVSSVGRVYCGLFVSCEQ
jgi:hypothetical protein